MAWFGKNANGQDAPQPAQDDPLRPFTMPNAADPLPRPEPAEPALKSSLAGLAGSAVPFEEPAPRAPEPVPTVAAEASLFSESVDVEGSIEGHGDVVLRGKVRGSVNITGCLIVGQGGLVQADVAAREVVNAGTVEGNITAAEKVRVQPSGVVKGDIDSPSIVIDDGGGVEGFVHMQPPGGAEVDDDDEVEFVPPPPLRSERTSKPPLPKAARFSRAPSSPAAAPQEEPAAVAPAAPAAPAESDDSPAREEDQSPPPVRDAAADREAPSLADPFADFTSGTGPRAAPVQPLPWTTGDSSAAGDRPAAPAEGARGAPSLP